MKPLKDIDLLNLARVVRESIGGRPQPRQILKTEARNVVVQELNCSDLQAEELVDTMELRGLLSQPMTVQPPED